jgi:nicotinamide riboside transporter PnuC
VVVLVLFLSILGMLFSLGGNLLIIFKKKSGWLAWIVGNILWIIINFIDVLNIPMVLMYVVYMIINIFGYIEWRRKEKKYGSYNKN